jgi:odorant receptor
VKTVVLSFRYFDSIRETIMTQIIDFESLFSIYEKCSKVVSFDVIITETVIQETNRRKRIVKQMRQLAKKVHFWSVTVFSVILLVLTITKSSTVTDFKDKMKPVPFMITVIVDTSKAIWFVLRKSQICAIIYKLRQLHPSTAEQQEKYQTRKFCKGLRTFQGIFMLMAIAIMVWFIFNPVYFSKDLYLPFSSTNIGIAEAEDVVLKIWMISTSCLSLALFFLMVTIPLLTAKGFDHLKMDLQELDTGPKNEQAQQMKTLIERHVDLDNLVKEVEGLLSPVFLLNFVQSSFVYCLTGYQMSTANETKDMINYGSYLVAVVIGNFFLCYGSQQIIDSSEGIAEAIYEINWYEIKDLKLRKELLLIMMRSQKASKLTAGKFSVVCLESLKFMLNTAYSYFTLLKAVYSTQ